MATTETRRPTNVLQVPIVDVDLITQLSKYWVVIVEQRENQVRIELYNR